VFLSRRLIWSRSDRGLDYQHIKERGRGGFGIVDEVKGDDGLLYARKTLVVPQHLNEVDVRPRFEREVRYQSAIKHQNVVHIFDSDLNSSPPWFTMQLAELSLYDEMVLDKTLAGNPRTALFHILAGLEEIHRLGYKHRDLKPQNVLKLAGLDGTPLYALSDFGLMAIGEDTTATLTPTGIGGGTPAYQAPECAINFKKASARSDIYSFGAILHDIFAQNPKRLPHEKLTAPGAIGPVIEKCTEKNHLRRYKDVVALREALFDALNNYQFQSGSNEEQKIFDLLTESANLPTPDQWDDIFDFIENADVRGQPLRNVFRALRRDHIHQLAADDAELMAALGKMYAEHCRLLSFDFEYCDVLAGKAQEFYDLGDIGLKAEIAAAMLVLGLDHNRWFVEWKFMRMVAPEIADTLAQRIIVEFEVLKVDFRGKFARLQGSISANVASLHPALQVLVG
jgi:eukaryotic-like serine/threonine-protein kinase